MDDIPELEQLKEPRRGIAPFAGGIKKKFEDTNYTFIESATTPLRDLGRFNMFLRKGKENSLEQITNPNDQAFTIDLSGKIQKGNLCDFFLKGYYEVFAGIDASTGKEIEENEDKASKRELKVTIWIHNNGQLISGNFDWMGEELLYIASFHRIDNSTKKLETFVLPDNLEILKAIRISISNK